MPLSIDTYGYVMVAALVVIGIINLVKKVFSHHHWGGQFHAKMDSGVILFPNLVVMETKKENIQLKNFPEGYPELTLNGNPFITKKRDIPVADRPKMYLKVRELLSKVTTDFASEVIIGR